MFHHPLKSKACSEKIIREKDVLSETDSFRDNKPVSKPVPGAAADSHCHLWQVQPLSISGSASVTRGLQPPAVYHLSGVFVPVWGRHFPTVVGTTTARCCIPEIGNKQQCDGKNISLRLNDLPCALDCME